jgi:hypothetical protein
MADDQATQFYYSSGEHKFLIRQNPSKSVGWKIYPGAFLLCGHLEPMLADLAGKTVLEVGAGVCGLPSILLANSGVTAIATVCSGCDQG